MGAPERVRRQVRRRRAGRGLRRCLRLGAVAAVATMAAPTYVATASVAPAAHVSVAAALSPLLAAHAVRRPATEAVASPLCGDALIISSPRSVSVVLLHLAASADGGMSGAAADGGMSGAAAAAADTGVAVGAAEVVAVGVAEGVRVGSATTRTVAWSP